MELFTMMIILLLIIFAVYLDNIFEPYYPFDPKYVSMMTFKKGKYTSDNKTPQLNCVEGNACKKISAIESVECINMGVNNDGQVKWSCSTDLPSDLTIGSMTINCKGQNPNTDSCSLNYSLNDENKYETYTINFLIWSFVVFIIIVFVCVVFIIPRPLYESVKSKMYDPYLNPYASGNYMVPIGESNSEPVEELFEE